MSRRRRLAGAAGVLLLLVVLAGFGFGPLVRHRVAVAARARRLDITIGSISVGWFALFLRDVCVTPAGTPVQVALREVRVYMGPALSPSRVEAHRAEVQIVGAPELVEARLREWVRAVELPGARERSSGAIVPVTVDGVSLIWRREATEAPLLEVTGGSADRSQVGWRGAFESARVRGDDISADALGVVVRLNEVGALEEIRASRVSLVRVSEGRVLSAPSPAPNDSSPPPLPLPTQSPSPGDADSAAAARLRLPELGALRVRLVALGKILRDRLADGARLDVEMLALEISDGARSLTIGRGPLTAVRRSEACEVTFTTQPNASGTPVSLSATLPLGEHDALVSFSGGPISLAQLGFEDGAAGLVDVARTTITGHGQASVPSAGDALTFDCELALQGLSVNRPSLASDIVRGVDTTLIARGVLDSHGALRVDDAEVSLGALHLVAHGSVEQGADQLAASLAFELPTTRCQALLDSIPSALIPTLDGSEVAGTLAARGRLAFDSRKLDDLLLDWKVDDLCSMSVVPDTLARERFRQPFEHTVYLPDGTLAEETTGPATDDWADLEHVSPFMQVAVLTTEDGAFYKHHGFNRFAMRNALVADLKAGRFARGASTITMQLAKNLFLFREKTLSRKLEEIILADYVEQVFSKKELMELYLNVIEFGPDLYGIGKASLRYFGRKPDELDLAESFFLASLLPAPLRFGKLADKPQLSDAWMTHLRQLMAIAAKNDLVSPEELAEGLREEVVFHDAKDPLPPPRPAVTGTHFVAPSDEKEVLSQPTRSP